MSLAKIAVGALAGAGLLGGISLLGGKKKQDEIPPGYDNGDVWDNPDEIVAGKEYKAFHDPKTFGV